MEKHRAIPSGYMTAGEMAKKMGVTVRTLQYYDKRGLLSPSATSEGGRRLYTDKDLLLLYQILSFKSIGFSLDNIREKLLSPGSMNTPAAVAEELAAQAEEIRRKIASLSESLDGLEKLREEVLLMQTVDFKRYADIITNLQMKNDFYWIIKQMDADSLNELRNRFDRESAQEFIDHFNRLNADLLLLQKEHVAPEDDRSQRVAKEFWDMVMEFTNGDMSILSEFMGLTDYLAKENAKQDSMFDFRFIESALEVYLSGLGIRLPEEEQGTDSLKEDGEGIAKV